MEKIFEARTEQEAVELAVKEFGVSPEFIDVEVIKRNKSGIFGLQHKVVIRASVTGLPHPEHHDDGTEEFTQAVNALDGDFSADGGEDEAANFELTEDMQSAIREFVGKITGMLGIDVQAIRMENGPYVEIDVENSDDQNLLIGKFGKNIEALQILINAMLQTKMREMPGWVIVDIEGYRKKRTAWLREMAVKKARQVLQSGKSYLMDDFSPYDRRQIHFAVKTIKGVETESEGTGYFKRVRIFLS